jgi:Ca-activated chloride channel family protein
MLNSHRFCLVVASVLALAKGPAAQDGKFLIVSPPEDSYVSGPFQLRARIEPVTKMDLLVSVEFFADGKQVCRIEQSPFACEWDAGPRVLPHVIRAVGTLKDGRRLTHTVRTKDPGYVDSVDVDVVQVTVAVTGGDGKFVKGLPREAFRVFEDDKPQTITHFASENIPLEMVVAVDVSGSMADAMDVLKNAVRKFLTRLSATDQVTLVGFNDNVFTLARRESNMTARSRAVDRLAPWGGTSLYDAIIKSLEMLGRQTGRRSLVVFSDGDDVNSHATMEAAIKRAEASDATLYMVGQGRATRIDKLKKLLDRLAETSGGRAFHTEKDDELDSAFESIIEELSNQYLISYPPTNATRDGSWRRIKVEVKGDYRVRARQGYRAMPAGKAR